MNDVQKGAARNRLSELLLIAIAVPVLGILMGGVYSLPAMKLTRERDPVLTLLLCVGLAVTVFGLGGLLHAPLAYTAASWAFTLVLLLVARWAYGGLDHNLERFGVVHVAAIVVTLLVATVARVQQKAGHPAGTTNHTTIVGE